MELDQHLSQRFLSQIQPFCEQHGLRLLSQEEFDSGNLHCLRTMSQVLVLCEPPVGGVVNTDEITSRFIRSFHITPLEPGTTGLYVSVDKGPHNNTIIYNAHIYCY